ncbi:MAG: alpha/beta hydrolase-fold protein [Chitinophagales bacterium]|nr:alpha/beta hydrolase-fold protein [Chitinophagales bacterium]MDW8427280.1 alpha/beta hydrolase-fold protein [Chitinophagales bacterium]
MRLWLIGLAVACSLQLSAATVVIRVVSMPSNTPPADPIYIAGTFNGWNPAHSSYKLALINGVPTITLQGNGTIEFKFTRGSWAKVECKADGSFLPNRTFTFGSADTLELSIAAWEDLISGNTSTALPNVILLSDSFYMPQLNRYRTIWLYLPDDYHTAPSKYYPVFYLQDGQNVFDAATSFAGEWQVDETLHALQQAGDWGCIVVAIANDGQHRIDEYAPFVNPAYGGGEGDAYLDFIVQTLKPYIDANYRTMPTRDYTAIGGSSMGGLIAFYAALRHDDVFGKAAVFSPSFWFDDSLLIYTAAHQKQWPLRLRFVAGYSESASMVPNIRNIYKLLVQAGYGSHEIDTSFHIDGQHVEWFWAREFGPAYQWLFSNLGAAPEPEISQIVIYPQPAHDVVMLGGPFLKGQPLDIHLFDSTGALLWSTWIRAGQPLSISHLPAGSYLIHIRHETRRYAASLRIAR